MSDRADQKAHSGRQKQALRQLEDDTVLLGGMPVGIYMETDGVMVLNTEQIEGIDGRCI